MSDECGVTFDHDHDCANDLYVETWRVARKPHQCSECKESILPRQRYQRVAGKSDGRIWQVNLCESCRAGWDSSGDCNMMYFDTVREWLEQLDALLSTPSPEPGERPLCVNCGETWPQDWREKCDFCGLFHSPERLAAQPVPATEPEKWNYRGQPVEGADARCIVTILEPSGMVYVGIRAYHHASKSWMNGNEPERATVLAWRPLDQPATGRWIRGVLICQEPAALPAEGCDERETALREALDYKSLYHELLYAVGNKWPGETRHQTALRYIRQAETSSGQSTAVLSTPAREPQS